MRRKKNKIGGISLTFLAVLLAMIDLMTNSAATGLLTAAMTIPHINPPPRNVAEKKVSIAPVALFIQQRWPTNFPHDIDTHVKCWQEVDGEKRNITVVNYIQKSQNWLDLQRDDLGRPSIINVEVVKSNSEVITIPPNSRCYINTHLYHSYGGELPVAGELAVIVDKDGDTEEAIAVVNFVLSKPGEELTLFYAEWDAQSQLIGSVKTYPATEFKPIATGGPANG